MTSKKNTNKALFSSVIALILCCSMLVGTTFAWFTDEVVTGMNTIAAGNLDVELLADGEQVKTDTPLFELPAPNLWEPGVVAYENLQVANVGTLALKYQMTLNFGNENNLNGHKLSEVLQVAVIDKIADGADRDTVLAAAEAAVAASGKDASLSNFYLTGELEAGKSSDEQTVVIFWAPNDNAVDNLYNANNGQVTSDGKPLHIEFGINLQAAQMMHENDSFGKDYDDFASILPKATVNNVSATYPTIMATAGIGGAVSEIPMDFALQFLPNETLEECMTSDYKYYNVTESGAVSTANSDAQDLVVKWANANIGEGKFAFGGWMNAGSTKMTQIDANNTEDIVLYPYFNNPYTARFVDQKGNVLAYCFFHAEDLTKLDATKDAAQSQLPAPGKDFAFDYWEVNANGTKVKYNKNNFANYEYDVTIYPVYRYTGNLKLTPVDEDNDGTIEYYKVEAVDTLDEVTTIPGNVNGVPVKVVEKLYKNDTSWDFGSGVKTIIIEEGVEELARNSLGYTNDLSKVVLPSTLTTLGKNTFSRNLWYNVFGGKDTKKLQIVYNGTKADWDKLVANSDKEWANGLKEGTTVECIDGTYTATSVNIETSNHKWTWTAK